MLTKMRAVKDMETTDGKFSEGDTFFVGEDRVLALTRSGDAERSADQTWPVAPVPFDLQAVSEAQKQHDNEQTADPASTRPTIPNDL